MTSCMISKGSSLRYRIIVRFETLNLSQSFVAIILTTGKYYRAVGKAPRVNMICNLYMYL